MDGGLRAPRMAGPVRHDPPDAASPANPADSAAGSPLDRTVGGLSGPQRRWRAGGANDLAWFAPVG